MTSTIPPAPPSQQQQQPLNPTTTEIITPLPPSALTTLLSTTTTTPPTPLSANTIQILHNLQHQHLWTSLRVHDLHLPSKSTTGPEQSLYLISGIPPHHLYIHPDEQLFMLERGLREDDVELERMFVLPTVQGESWTLRKLAGVFDSLPEGSEEVLEGGGEKAEKLREYYEYRGKARATKEWGWCGEAETELIYDWREEMGLYMGYGCEEKAYAAERTARSKQFLAISLYTEEDRIIYTDDRQQQETNRTKYLSEAFDETDR
ncbi:hypothetical protein BDQ94DRAFT_185107 [Aspergillus welwitschiae]|uniref:tRNA-splicing endonuclease subunit Sen15 domain-containing protein n=1 Tax=Aspergillus welwitschiae TaxID=1341132 RepID=A0A3F3PLI6_9EURO|nr:hypothetical protein BDQ94DRAFT_185107 [Aspergillus welwitschiae]RDH27216.1 hypothetical protein BDQ94DRAFT_185107 [Aspergillus welwitschiae]